MAFGALKGSLTLSLATIVNPADAAGSVVVAVGDLIFVCIAEQTGLTAGTPATDNLGNTYTALTAGTLNGTAVSVRCYYSRVTVAGTLTVIHIPCTGSTHNVTVSAEVIEGPFTASPLDVNPAVATTDVTSPFTTPLTGTLAQADEVVIAYGAANYGTVWTATSPNLLGKDTNSATLVKCATGYQKVTATTSISADFAAAANPTAIILGICSFKKDLNQALTPGLFTSGNGFNSQDLLATYSLAPALFSDSDTFYTQVVDQPVASQNLSPPLYTDADTFYVPAISVGAVSLVPTLFTDADSFFVQTIGLGTVNLAPSLFTDVDTFYTPAVSATIGLVPALYTDADTFFVQVIGRGAVNLTPTLYTDADSFFIPAITAGPVGLTQSARYTDVDTFYTPEISQGTILQVSLYTDADSFFVPVIVRGAVALVASLHVDGDAFPQAAILAEQTLTAAKYTDADTFYSPIIGVSAINLRPALFADPDILYASAVGIGAINLGPAQFNNANAFYSPVIQLIDQYLIPVLFVDVDLIYESTIEVATIIPVPPERVATAPAAKLRVLIADKLSRVQLPEPSQIRVLDAGKAGARVAEPEFRSRML